MFYKGKANYLIVDYSLVNARRTVLSMIHSRSLIFWDVEPYRYEPPAQTLFNKRLFSALKH
jgi:hypothetical protein